MELIYKDNRPGLFAAHLKWAGPIKGKVLDLRCGTGEFASGFKSAGWEVHGLDTDPHAVNHAARVITARLGNFTRLPYPDRIFDLVTLKDALTYLDQRAEVLRETRRVLKPSGRLIISQPVPFADADAEAFKAIHGPRARTALELVDELSGAAFSVLKKQFVVQREAVHPAIGSAVVHANDEYRRAHNVEVRDGMIFEDRNIVVLLAQPRPN